MEPLNKQMESAIRQLKELEPSPLSEDEEDALLAGVFAQLDALQPSEVSQPGEERRSAEEVAPRRGRALSSMGWALAAALALFAVSGTVLSRRSPAEQQRVESATEQVHWLTMEARPGLAITLVDATPILLKIPGSGEVLLTGEGALSIHSLSRPELRVERGRFRAKWRPNTRERLVFRGEKWRFAMNSGESWVQRDAGGLSFEQISGQSHWVKRVAAQKRSVVREPIEEARSKTEPVKRVRSPRRQSSVPSAQEMYDVAELFLHLEEGPQALEAAEALLRNWPESVESDRIRFKLAEYYQRSQPEVSAELYRDLLKGRLSGADRDRATRALCRLSPSSTECF